MKALLLIIIFLFHPMTLAESEAANTDSCDLKASKESIEFLKNNIEIFINQAMYQNISPVALVGSILAAQNFRPKVTAMRKVKRRAIGWNFSTGKKRKPSSPEYFGPARISLAVASELNKSDKSKESSDLQEQLGSGPHALKHTAKYIHFVGQTFAKNGQKNVQDRADLLASVLSQGSAQQLAQEQAYNGEKLTPNEWGDFVNCNRATIAEIFVHLREKGDHVLVEKGCVYAPKVAKSKKDWKYRCMTMKGIYPVDLLPESLPSDELQISELKK